MVWALFLVVLMAAGDLTCGPAAGGSLATLEGINDGGEGATKEVRAFRNREIRSEFQIAESKTGA